MTFRLHILYEFKEGPWGGGNQFLKALRDALIKQDAYSNDPFKAQAFLFNSHHLGPEQRGLDLLYALKSQAPECPVLHRIDGPIGLIRGGGFSTDRLIFKINHILASGTVFQTRWSMEESLRHGLQAIQPITHILNAPDPALFYPAPKHPSGEKIKLIATSWAANARKGFDLYAYLDTHLDFTRYTMTFVGNSPLPFRNIRHIPAVDSRSLGELLRAHDIYITASRNDPCSNALCEALHCGLPALVLDSGGHPEILGNGGLPFEGAQDILEKIDTLTAQYDHFRNAIALPDIQHIAAQYLDFAKLCSHNAKACPPLSQKTLQALKKTIRRHHLAERLKNAISRRWKGQSA